MQGKFLALALAVAALPMAAHAAGDPKAGARKNSMCVGCHGIEDYKMAYPSVYHVPKIGGQHADYLVAALNAYRSGARRHATMRAVAAQLSDQDILDLAAYYAAKKPNS